MELLTKENSGLSVFLTHQEATIIHRALHMYSEKCIETLNGFKAYPEWNNTYLPTVAHHQIKLAEGLEYELFKQFEIDNKHLLPKIK